MRRKINVEEQLAQILLPQLWDEPFNRPPNTVTAKRIAQRLGVDVATLYRARKANPVVARLVTKPKGRVMLNVKNQYEWVELQTAVILHAHGGDAKSVAAKRREAGRREKKKPRTGRG